MCVLIFDSDKCKHLVIHFVTSWILKFTLKTLQALRIFDGRWMQKQHAESWRAGGRFLRPAGCQYLTEGHFVKTLAAYRLWFSTQWMASFTITNALDTVLLMLNAWFRLISPHAKHKQHQHRRDKPWKTTSPCASAGRGSERQKRKTRFSCELLNLWPMIVLRKHDHVAVI